MKETLEQLTTGKQRLIDKGWFQGNNRKAGQHCAFTALPTCASLETIRALYVALPKNHLRRYPSSDKPTVAIIAFNDNPKTTEKDILDLYDRAIAWEKV